MWRQQNNRYLARAYYGYWLGVNATARTYYQAPVLGPHQTELLGMLDPARSRHNVHFGTAHLHFNVRGDPRPPGFLVQHIVSGLQHLSPNTRISVLLRDTPGRVVATPPFGVAVPLPGANGRTAMGMTAVQWTQVINQAANMADDDESEPAALNDIVSITIKIHGLDERTWYDEDEQKMVPMAPPTAERPIQRRRGGCAVEIPPELLNHHKAIWFAGTEDSDVLCGVRSLCLAWANYMLVNNTGKVISLLRTVKRTNAPLKINLKNKKAIDNFRTKTRQSTRAKLVSDIIERAQHKSEAQIKEEKGCTWDDLGYYLAVISELENQLFTVRMVKIRCGAYHVEREIAVKYHDEAKYSQWEGQEAKYLYILHLNGKSYEESGHYLPIASMTMLAGDGRAFCEVCCKTYVNREKLADGTNVDRPCPNCFSVKCRLCHSTTEDHELKKVPVENRYDCEDCSSYFHTIECYELHITNNVCQTIKRCPTCKSRVKGIKPTIKNKLKEPSFKHHVCGEYKCRGCGEKVTTPHYCDILPGKLDNQLKSEYTSDFKSMDDALYRLKYLESIASKEKKTKWDLKSIRRELRYLDKTLIFADFECQQDNPESIHEVNLVCSEDRHGNAMPDFDHPETWMEYLFERYPRGGTIVMHNGSGYDYILLLPILKYMQCDITNACMTGSKIKFFQVNAPGKQTHRGLGGWRFIDSMCFIACGLSQFTQTFGLTTKKGFFPHKCNSPNWPNDGRMPSYEDFGPELMTKTKQDELKEWLNERKQEPWFLEKELLAYCKADVKLLREGCMAFQNIIETITRTETHWGVLPFNSFFTIPSTAMRIWSGYFNTRDLDDDVPIEAWLPRLPKKIHEELMPAMVGGRTEPTKFLWNKGEGPCAQYVDFTSLYPWVNKNCRYPLGHPIETSDFEGDAFNLQDVIDSFYDSDGNLVHPDQLPMMVCKVDVKCPDDLYLPLLHEKLPKEHKLMFTLRDKKEMLYTGHELLKAFELGYKVTHWYKTWKWVECKKGLFKDYINTFLQIKQQAAGWGDCKTEEEKDKYINDYKEKEGILLDRGKIEKNPGLYRTSKFFLNSLWGKFGQKLPSQYKQREILDGNDANDVRKWQQLSKGIGQSADDTSLFADQLSMPLKPGFELCDHQTVILDSRFMFVTYKMNPVKAQEENLDRRVNRPYDPYYDPIHSRDLTGGQCAQVAIFTTAHARLKLYSLLEKLEKRVIYYDTDSCIFAPKPGEDPNDLAPLGKYLGDLTNELNGKGYDENGIEYFVSGGPKHYGYRLVDGKETWKVKGIRSNQQGIQEQLCLQDMHNAVVYGADELEIKTTAIRAQDFVIRTVEEVKTYRATCTKRRSLITDKKELEKATIIDTAPWQDKDSIELLNKLEYLTARTLAVGKERWGGELTPEEKVLKRKREQFEAFERKEKKSRYTIF